MRESLAMSFTSIAIEISTACTRCRAPLPLNGASESVLCDKCQTPNETTADLWSSVLGEAVDTALALAKDEGKTSTILTAGRTISLMVGHQDARCTSCKAPFDPDAFERGAASGKLFCTSCGKQAAVRRAPDWMRSIHPAASFLVGETMAATVARGVDPKDLRFHCYHCGAPLPLDGSARSVSCAHCRASVMVPDDIWLRLHPARVVDRWYLVLALDLTNAKGTLPEDVDEFCDVCTEPGGNVIIAYLANERGYAGHASRIALLQPSGALAWIQDGIEFSDEARLVTSPADGTCLLVDKENKFARVIDPRTGDPLRTFGPLEGDDGPSTPMNVDDVRSIAIDWDGSYIVSRDWSDFADGIRRFAPDGRRVPTWPGMHLGEGEKGERIEWPKWPRKHPVRPPLDARVVVGWDGAVYFGDEHGVAKYTREGMLVGVVTFPEKLIYDFAGFTVARDGTITILGDHGEEIGDSHWPHLYRVSPSGHFAVAAGPAVSEAPFLGRYADRIKGAPDGMLVIAGDVDDLRVLAADGRVLWMTNATRRSDESSIKRLAEARRGKKHVADRA